ncbi:uncharacterized protein SOCE836_105100 [Sorangium cellulosum]|uniref:Uncharacterized protein n=1 Tax=Sorangium cellulosum TaxID=56 RepID=A0A4P2R586_SORCE|nr:uncharacterized protein SOCE836_105100 [Sorangium cellulosum]
MAARVVHEAIGRLLGCRDRELSPLAVSGARLISRRTSPS